MPTARVSLILAESDETTRREIRDIAEAKSFVEKYDGGVTLDGGVTDVEIIPPQIDNCKLLVLTAEDGIIVKLNANDATAMTGVTLLVLSAEEIESLYLSNEGDEAVKVRMNMYGDA
jgi:hypothetical protein